MFVVVVVVFEIVGFHEVFLQTATVGEELVGAKKRKKIVTGYQKRISHL